MSSSKVSSLQMGNGALATIHWTDMHSGTYAHPGSTHPEAPASKISINLVNWIYWEWFREKNRAHK